MAPTTTFTGHAPAWHEELVRMWRQSFEFGVGIADPHPICEQIAQLVGFVAADNVSVSQLHVRVGHHRQGIGSQLLLWAKRRSSGSLWLSTLTRNTMAQAFYEHHGFVIVARGFEPVWQLEDTTYQWVAAPEHAADLLVVPGAASAGG